MEGNPILKPLLERKSIRRYRPEAPSDEVIEAVVRAGQQAPFAAQMGSLLLSRDRERHPFQAPLLFTVLVDVHRLERVLAARGWVRKTCDLAILLFGIQDAAYMAENMVKLEGEREETHTFATYSWTEHMGTQVGPVVDRSGGGPRSTAGVRVRSGGRSGLAPKPPLPGRVKSRILK